MDAPAKPPKKAQLEPEINVTPLVDVVLVLLIIFMVIAPELANGERVELPVIQQPDETSKTTLDPITVTVTRVGSLLIEKEAVEGAEALRGRLRDEHDREPSRRVVLRGDGATPYAKMRDVFALCQDIGFSGVSLSVSQRGGGAKAAE